MSASLENLLCCSNNSSAYSNGTNQTMPKDLNESKNFYALFLLFFPLFTVLGNGLVVASVVKTRSLQTPTNYLVANLAVADFLVAFCVMPFAVYVEVENSIWKLPKMVCNIYISADVCASTASIFNLVAISWDRFIAINQPMAYARKCKKSRRVVLVIASVWIISLLIALPVIFGLNKLEDTRHCEFTNAAYIVGSSVGSFYLPCLAILVLYGVVLKTLHSRLQLRLRQDHDRAISSLCQTNGSNKTEDDATSTSMDDKKVDGVHGGNPVTLMPVKLAGHAIITASGISRYLAECIPEDVEPLSSLGRSEDDDVSSVEILKNDDGKPMPSNDFEVSLQILDYHVAMPFIEEPKVANDSVGTSAPIARTESLDASSPDMEASSEKCCGSTLKVACCSILKNSPQKSKQSAVLKSSSFQSLRLTRRPPFFKSFSLSSEDVVAPPAVKSDGRRVRHSTTSSRQSLASKAVRNSVLQKVSRQRLKETRNFHKEKRATYTLAVVLGVFLLCWVPFFTCHLTNSVCMLRLEKPCIPFLAFFFTTWLGYMNSFMNPVIYTVFNAEYRKAFKKLLIGKAANHL